MNLWEGADHLTRGAAVKSGMSQAGDKVYYIQFFLPPSPIITLRIKFKLKTEFLCPIRCICGDGSQDRQCCS